MSTAAVHAALASGYVQKMIKVKACQLRRRPEFARTDLKDIQQELVTHILKRAPQFNPVRGAPTTFIAAVIGTAVPMMCRDRRRFKRAGAVRNTSLDACVLEQDGEEEVEVSLADQLSEPDRLRHRCTTVYWDAADQRDAGRADVRVRTGGSGPGTVLALERPLPAGQADSQQTGERAMKDDCERYKTVCQDEFASIHRKLDNLDTAIRGNGKPGIQLRLDRLEEVQRLRSRIVWLIIGAAITLAASAAWRWIWSAGQ